MRVIGGDAKGRRIKVPKGKEVRPTAARVKEALFNILSWDLCGAKVLDLFAGTGNLSIEALSRGAAEVILIDSSRESGKAIRENLRKLGLCGRSKVWVTPVFRALRLLSRRGERFDCIFLDPPYENQWAGKTVDIIASGNLLRDHGIVVVEHSVREPVQPRYRGLALRDQRRYGSTLLSFFAHEAGQDS